MAALSLVLSVAFACCLSKEASGVSYSYSLEECQGKPCVPEQCVRSGDPTCEPDTSTVDFSAEVLIPLVALLSWLLQGMDHDQSLSTSVSESLMPGGEPGLQGMHAIRV